LAKPQILVVAFETAKLLHYFRQYMIIMPIAHRIARRWLSIASKRQSWTYWTSVCRAVCRQWHSGADIKPVNRYRSVAVAAIAAMAVSEVFMSL
jgi:hypothetical protein